MHVSDCFLSLKKKWHALRSNLCGIKGRGFLCLGSIFFISELSELTHYVCWSGIHEVSDGQASMSSFRKVGALWSDWKLKLVSLHPFGDSLGLVCVLLWGKSKPTGKGGWGRRPVSTQGVVPVWPGPKVVFRMMFFDKGASKVGF